MATKLDILLEGEGIVIFDPFNLEEFAKKWKIASTNLFQHFIEYPQIGDDAIRRGIVLPIYPIPAIDYQIIFNESRNTVLSVDLIKLTTRAFPLSISPHNKIIAADIYSIMNWHADFYKRLQLNGPVAPQVASSMATGYYSVIVNGFVDRKYAGRGPKTIGYELLMHKVDTLPTVPHDVDVESENFILWTPGQQSE